MLRRIFILLAVLFCGVAKATLMIPVYQTNADGSGAKIGTIAADDTVYGLLLTPHLRNLSPGVHGFHLHTLPFCSNFGRGAGGHFDPERTDSHEGPYSGSGHLGDLPVMVVDEKGRAHLPLLAPRLKLSLIKGKALLVDAKGDSYSDDPQKNGGGGRQVACGVVGYF